MFIKPGFLEHLIFKVGNHFNLIKTKQILLGNFPEGQIMDHGKAEGIDERTAKERFSSEEKRALDRLQQDIYQEIRHAAEAHRQVCILRH